MKRFEEYNTVKSYLNRIAEGGDKQYYVKKILEIQSKDNLFIKNMLLYSKFYNEEARLVRNLRAIDILDNDIRAFMLISYQDLVKKMG